MNGKIISILGPTNTGKTHLAIERMLEFSNGVIGFPLRLLAREIYDKVVNKIGVVNVALITGEEKIIPGSADYYLCTVESMPLDINFEFVAIDEIQMCADPDRGHIFTDRLHQEEIYDIFRFIIIKILLNNWLQNVNLLIETGYLNLLMMVIKNIKNSTKKRSYSFFVDEVYALAELVRRQRGGEAKWIIESKTRNAQVKLYQSGDVDFLVATDAIGMGINMDIDGISFSSIKNLMANKSEN